MGMHPVRSSNITHIGHEGDILHIIYKGGGTYGSKGVTEDQHKIWCPQTARVIVSIGWA